MTGGAVVPHEKKQSLAEIVNAGVGVTYEAAYISAMRAQLPDGFRDDPVNVIALGIRAKMSGLNPFTQIHAWKGDGGRLTFQIDYKGFIDIAARDPRVESLEFQHVYEGEDFQWTKRADGKVMVQHTGGLKAGRCLGAYCVAHMTGDMADHMEMRLMEDFKHLFNKQNWRNNPSEMVMARVLSSTIRVVCPESTQGLYSEADWGSEAWDPGAVASGAAQAATAAAQEELAAKLAPGTVIEVDGPAVDPTVEQLQKALEKQESQSSEPADPEAGSPNGSTSASAEDSFEEKRFHCGYCITDYKNQRSLAGHGRAHKEEKKAEAMLPEGCVIMRDGELFVGYDADGVIQHTALTWLGVFGQMPLAPEPESVLTLPEGYEIQQEGELFVPFVWVEPGEPAGPTIPGHFFTWDDACLAAINYADAAAGLEEAKKQDLDKPDPTSSESESLPSTEEPSSSTTTAFEVPKLAEIYRQVADKGFKTTMVITTLNSIEYADTFEPYRKEGEAQIQPLSLDEDGRRELVDVLRLRQIID